jgi:hypothetical protein
LIYKINKTDKHFEECYESIQSIYIQNEIGKKIDTVADALFDSAKYTEFLKNLDRSTISMQ